MVVFVVFGVIVNGYVVWKVFKGKIFNEWVVFWYLLEDVLGWVGVLIVVLILFVKDIYYFDFVLFLFIMLYVLWNVVKCFCEIFYFFL